MLLSFVIIIIIIIIIITITIIEDIGLAGNIGKTNYMEVGRSRGMMANEHIVVGNSYEKVKTFKYLGSLLANQNSIHEETKCRLKACPHRRRSDATVSDRAIFTAVNDMATSHTKR